MRKSLFLFLILCLLPFCVLAESNEIITMPIIDISPWQVPYTNANLQAQNMIPGWNLGNALDCYDEKGVITPGENDLLLDSMWSGAPITKEGIQKIAESGFHTIRIPVSWHDHIIDSAYTINPMWMARVQEVVDWALDCNLYVIINVHHDTSVDYIYPTRELYNQSRTYLTAIWKQICSTFKNYDNHLIFEGQNEPRLKDTAVEWAYDYTNEDCIEASECINRLNQVFVDTVRASGGNNADRYLMVPAYAAYADTAVFDNFVVPTDSTPDRLMISVHAYLPLDFALNADGTDYFDMYDTEQTSIIDNAMSSLYDKYVKNGIPVIIGEFGATDKNNLSDRIDYTGYYSAKAYERGMTAVIWDNANFDANGESYGLLDRNTDEWVYPEIIDAMMLYSTH